MNSGIPTKKTVLLGSGGHASVVLSLARLVQGVIVIGVVTAEQTADRFRDVPVLGDDSVLPSLVGRGATYFAMGIGSLGDPTTRIRCYCRCLEIGLEPLSLTHPSAVVDQSASIGEGTVILAQCVVGAGSTLGKNVIINNGAIIEHGCVVADHAHIATGACPAGEVRVGRGAHVGIGATVRQGIAIGHDAIVGAGAVVIRDVPPGVTVVGVPARPKGRSD